jgi:hypothetical protein
MTSWFIPTTQTKFRIDRDWWEQSGRDFRLYLRDQLCPSCQLRFPDHRNTEMVDWVDPETGEVQRADALWQCLTTMCANEPDYIHPHMPLVTAIFRALLRNGNKPLSPQELHDLYIPWKMPDVILRTLTGGKVHLGLRPVERD